MGAVLEALGLVAICLAVVLVCAGLSWFARKD